MNRSATRSFVDKLTMTIEKNDSLLCVGLDPDPERIPARYASEAELAERLRALCLDIIEQTADLVCCYKPNFAFFEQAGPEGLRALQDVVAAVPDSIPIILDAKRGDIGNTARAYARAAFDVWCADAVTVSPYLGADSVAPFLLYEGKMVLLLCYTSNPSAKLVQDYGSVPLYQYIAREGQAWGRADQLGFVVGATQVAALAAVRQLAPERWLLAPGVGAQGGDLDAALSTGLDADGSGLIVPVSRGVLYAEDPRSAAKDLRARINRGRQGTLADRNSHRELILDLFEAGCIRFGSFTLASGKTSPIYIDLRRAISYPDLFQKIVTAYTEVIEPLSFDRLAAVPYAALPAAAAVAMRLRRPLVYPRKQAKDHGTAQSVEGAFEPGQIALAIEDVVTSGGSLLTAIATMEAVGLEVRDVVVLVDREQGGDPALARAGYRLHAVLTLGRILEMLRREDKIDAATLERVQEYLRS